MQSTLPLLLSLLPLLAYAAPAGDDGGDGGVPEGGVGSTQSPTEAGASGDDTSSFSLSKGALIAIIVVVVVVVVLGATSLILWYLAKKRQWEVRASIRRASRRLTGRSVGPAPSRSSRAAANNRRTAIRMDQSSRPATTPATTTKSTHAPAKYVGDEDVGDVEKGLKSKRGAAAVGVTDESGSENASAFEAETPKRKTFKDKIAGWRR